MADTDETTKPLCVHCNTPWSDENQMRYDGEILDSAATGHVISDSIELTCHSCGKVMYRKEGA